MGIASLKHVAAMRPLSLADALFSSTQQQVLAFLFGQPDRSFFATELIKLVGAGSGAVQRELAKLAQTKLVTVSYVGTQKHYQANPDSPIFQELCGIATKTVGLAEPLRTALAPLAERITAAFVFGSVAKRSDTASSDIDVLILAENLDYAEVYEALQSAESRLSRGVNPMILHPEDWRQRHGSNVAFITKVASQPKIFLYGSEAVLG